APAAAADSAAADLDDSRLHSVLKRARPVAPEAAALPPQQSPPITPPAELPRRNITTITPSASPPGRSSASTSATAARTTANTSATSKSAALKVEIAGPQGVTVGKPALYVVTMNNESDIAAEEVHLRIP